MSKIYEVTFKAKLTEDDIRAMHKYFYETMNDYMNIYDIWDLSIVSEEV